MCKNLKYKDEANELLMKELVVLVERYIDFGIDVNQIHDERSKSIGYELCYDNIVGITPIKMAIDIFNSYPKLKSTIVGILVNTGAEDDIGSINVDQIDIKSKIDNLENNPYISFHVLFSRYDEMINYEDNCVYISKIYPREIGRAHV